MVPSQFIDPARHSVPTHRLNIFVGRAAILYYCGCAHSYGTFDKKEMALVSVLNTKACIACVILPFFKTIDSIYMAVRAFFINSVC